MGNYAVIDVTGLIVNAVIWDGETEWAPPEGTEAVPIPEGSAAGIGWTYVSGEFVAPEPPPPVPKTPEQVLAENTATRNVLLDAATRAIAPLQDAVDIGEATDADTAMLKAWKTFRVAVNRIVLTDESPQWPSPPQSGYGAAIAPVTLES